MAAAELKLQVGLDLAFFRQQLAQLASASVGYSLPINIDRLAIQKEITKLGRNISSRKYTLKIDTTVKSAASDISNLQKALEELEKKSVNVQITGTGNLNPKEARRIRAALGRSVLSNGGKIKIPATILAAITQDDVTAFTRAAQARLKGIALNVRADITSSADGLDTKEVRKIRVALRNAILSNGGKIKIPATIQPNISNDEVASFRKLVQEKFKGISVTVGVDPQVSSKGSAAQASQGQPRGYETALESIKKLNPEQLRSRAVKSLGEESRTAQQISNWVDILQADKGMGRGDKNKQLTAIRNVLAKALAESVGQSIEAKLQPLRGQKAMEAPRSASNINKILDPIANFTQNPGTARRMLRMLPESNISTNTLDVASRQARYYENTPSAREMQGKIKGFDPVMKAIAGDFANYTKGLSPSNPWVGNISRGIARMVSAAATSPQAQKLLPAAGQSSASRMMRSAFSVPPPMGGGIPPSPPAPPTPPGGGRGGRGGGMGAFPNISLPGAGLISELGGEFAMAAKQVLLFGTAYKALAFLTDFPSKVGEAVAQLQTFRNTLQAITPNANEFQKSNQFILDTVAKYNTPLQSARDGFTNLYASMAPAGFKGDEIRNIFTGISQGAATFGMSADKVDRVNYAFAQMASKGQVMSEELKGQLGDVLPGAVAIFAKAAGFTGPNAMVEFTKAMEEGRYKGEAMKQLLINVGIVMKDKFAKGAEGAAQNFQGQMNAMANATKKLYEAFEPAGNLFSSKVIAPFTEGLTVITDGFNAFFTGVATKTAGGFALSQELEKLRPTFQGLSENVKQFLPLLQSFANTALGLAKVLLQIASNPFVGYLARIYAIVLPLNIALSVMRGLWASNAIQLLVLNARLASGTSMLTAFRSMMAATGATSAATAATIRGAFATTGVGLILVGLGLLIERFASMNQKLMDMKSSALGAAEAIRRMSQAEARQEENKASKDVKTLEALLSKKNKGATAVPITDEQQQALERAGVRTGRMALDGTMAAPGSAPDVFKYTQKAVDVTQVQSALLARKGIASEASYRVKQLKFDEVQSQQQLPPVPLATGDGRAARIPLEQLLDRSSSRAAQSKAAALDLALNERILQAKKDGNEAEEASLENLRPVIKARGELAALTEFHNMLIKNEAKIVGKSLTQAQFKERLQLAGQKMTLANSNYKNRQVDLKKKEFEEGKKILEQQQEEGKKILEQQQEYERTLEDIKIKNGEMSDEDTRRIEKLRQYQDILKANPNLTEVQKTDLFNAINAAPVDIIGEKLKAYRKNLDDLTNSKNQIVGIAESIGEAFSSSFKGIIDGSMTAQQALGSFFQSIGNYFVDMAARMIAEWIKVQALEGIKTILSAFGGGAAPAAGGAGIAGGQGIFTAANGGIAPGGFRAFATGGIVTGPTLGLVGEGKYNEAVIPLPDGKSVPVDLGGMSGGGAITSNIVINMNSDGQSSSNANGSNSAELGRKIEGAVKQVMVAELRPGGILAGRR